MASAAPRVAGHLDRCQACRQLLAAILPASTSPSAGVAGSAPQVGDRLGRYQILEVVGAGAQGLVYAAHDPDLGRKVALKLLRSTDPSGGPELRLRLIREAQSLARLSHPNVVAVHDVGTVDADGPEIFLAMDLVEGGTLTTWLAAQPRRWREVLAVFLQAGDGLAAAHEAGLVHRDFKPDNVLVGTRGEVRVTDFGLARWSATPGPGEVPAANDPRLDLTRTGAVLGTPAFMAPEQLDGKADPRSDQFSFCVALYLALYGQRPFPGATGAEVRQAIVAGKGPRVPPAAAGVPQRIRKVLWQGLAADPARRFATMRDLLAALRRPPTRRAVRIAAVAALCGVAGLALHEQRREAGLCTGAEAAWGSTWSTSQRERVRAAFLANKAPGVPEVFDRFDAALLEFRRRWIQQSTDSCAATFLRHQASEEVFALRGACLDDRRRAAEQLVKLFDPAASNLIGQAVHAAVELPGPEACAHTEALKALAPRPADAAAQAELAQLSDEEARVEAQRMVGHYAEALEIVEPAVVRAAALGYRPIWGRLLLHQGTLLERLGHEEASEQTMWTTAAIADEAHDDATLADVWTWFAFVASERRQWATAERFYRLGEASRVRLGGDALREADWSTKRAGTLAYQERWQEAEELIHHSLSLLAGLGLEEDWRAVEALDALGGIHEGQGRLTEALADFQRTVALRKKIFEPTARDIGGGLLDLAEVERRLERPQDALTHAREGTAIRRAGSGLQFDADGESQLAAAYRAAGQLGEAERHDQRALADAEAQGGPDDWRASWGLLGLGQDRLAGRRAAEAVPPLERAARLRAHDQPPDADVPFALARALWESGGDRERARALAAAAAEALRDRAEKYGSYYARQRAEIQEWLAGHPVP